MCFWSSVLVLAPSLLRSIALSIVTGYALARWEERWAGTSLYLPTMCAFVPFQVIICPLIARTRALGLYGTIGGVAAAHATIAMMSAAIMDSGALLRISGEVVLPLSGNILIVVLMLQTTSIWNGDLGGVTFRGFNAQPMTVTLANMVTVPTGPAACNVDTAAELLTAMPRLPICFLLGKFVVAGITADATDLDPKDRGPATVFQSHALQPYPDGPGEPPLRPRGGAPSSDRGPTRRQARPALRGPAPARGPSATPSSGTPARTSSTRRCSTSTRRSAPRSGSRSSVPTTSTEAAASPRAITNRPVVPPPR